jgi:hypothetical protein
VDFAIAAILATNEFTTFGNVIVSAATAGLKVRLQTSVAI